MQKSMPNDESIIQDFLFFIERRFNFAKPEFILNSDKYFSII